MNSTKSILFLSTENGDFFLIDGVVVSSKATSSSLRELFPNNDIWDVGAEFYQIYFEKCPFEGKGFDISICSKGEKPKTIFFSMKEKYTLQENWTEEYELQTGKLYKEWLVTHIEEEWEFVWGRVGTAFDRKGGGINIWVGYIRFAQNIKKCDFGLEAEFSDTVALYYLDVDLRNILMRYINKIEINFRAEPICYVSDKYRSFPAWFADPAIISQSFIDSINKFYSRDFIRNSVPIKRHRAKYPNDIYAPAWKTLKFFSFGMILKTYKNLIQDDIKEEISNLYGIKKPKESISSMKAVVLVRNTCAHSAVLSDFNTPRSILSIPRVSFERNDHSLLACIKVIAYILRKISSPGEKDMLDSIRSTLHKHDENRVINSVIRNKAKVFNL